VPSPNPLSTALLDGYRRFRTTRYPVERQRFQQLAEAGQRPRTMVVGCSDSRSGPETVFDAGPGELFVVRNVAGLVPGYTTDSRHNATSAALEYAVMALGVETILVMGHGRCGGISAAIGEGSPLTATDFMGAWIGELRDLADELDPSDWSEPARYQRALERRAVEQALVNLETFPWIRSRVRAGRLALTGAWFDIAIGELHELTPGGWRVVP
jgi:carbonic anhydrase